MNEWSTFRLSKTYIQIEKKIGFKHSLITHTHTLLSYQNNIIHSFIHSLKKLIHSEIRARPWTNDDHHANNNEEKKNRKNVYFFHIKIIIITLVIIANDDNNDFFFCYRKKNNVFSDFLFIVLHTRSSLSIEDFLKFIFIIIIIGTKEGKKKFFDIKVEKKGKMYVANGHIQNE